MTLRAALPALLLAACASAGPSIATLRDARFILLGEVHDNAEQHRQRAALLRELLADGRPTRVVFEQMGAVHDAAIAAARRNAEALAVAGRLDRDAWRWPLHRPLIEAALAGGATIAGGDLERDQVRAIVRGGLDAAPADIRRTLADDASWGAADQQALQRIVEAAHCNALPASQVAPMALAQRARDAALARAMLRAPPGTRAVLIAGNGHVRNDLGVPHYLRAAGVAPSAIVAIGFVERGDDEAAVYDAVRVTAKADRTDPCAAFR